MGMALLDRHTQLAGLAAAQRAAAAGRGGLVVVSGEAGVRKTALVEQFVDQSNARVSSTALAFVTAEAN